MIYRYLLPILLSFAAKQIRKRMGAPKPSRRRPTARRR